MTEKARMERALRAIGYSAHSGSPRIGPKAQVARWGLGEDVCPHERRDEVGLDRWRCTLCGEVET